jgi:hypothetical protein
MTEFDKTNRGSIWKNDKKEKDTHPDFTGSLNVGGVEYWVSAWKRKEGAAAKAPALSFSIKLKEERGAAKGSKKPAQDFGDDMDDAIPF